VAATASKTGRLHIVATPLGNVGDLSPRALSVLRDVDVVAAEDTRHSGRLLAHLGIRTPLVSCHEHNERGRADELLARLAAGQSVALISDAGTPLISDPGFELVRRARAAGVEVVAVPGPSAVTAALSVAGLPSDRFVFEGFPPAKRAARRQYFRSLRTQSRTMVFYESPHRIVASLADLCEAFGGDRPAVLARELTKLHEEVRDGTLETLHGRVQSGEIAVRGEFVIVVAGAAASAAPGDDVELERILRVLLERLPPAEAAAAASAITGAPRRHAYAMCLELRRSDDP